MFLSSPKKRKSEDSEQHSNERSTQQSSRDCSRTSVEDLPSCSTKRTRLENIQNVSSDYNTSVSTSSLQNEDQRLGRVREIISREFIREIKSKEAQLELVDERLEEAKNLLERLRYAIVAEYYKKQEQTQTMIDAAATMNSDNASKDRREQLSQIPLHPSLKKIIGKRPKSLAEIMRACPKREAAKNAKHVLNTKSAAERREERRLQKVIREKGIVIDHTKQNIKVEPSSESTTESQSTQAKCKETINSLQFVKTEHVTNRLEGSAPHILNHTRTSNKLKCHFVVGNTSKYIGKNYEHTQAGGNTSFSHKWLVYVQTKDTEVPIEKYVKKVRFFLHPSYRPNDVVDIHEPPFQVARRGWGEFPMRIQLFFHESFQQKPLQLVHKVVLDITKSGRHTLGAETVVEIWLRNEAATTSEQHVKCENASQSSTAISITTTNTTTKATPTTPEISRKPRTISFNMKETFDDNFFDFLNKIEESRSSICADIEKIEPTLLVNELFEPNFSNNIRSPIKKELRSPLKLTPLQSSPSMSLSSRLTPQNTNSTGDYNAIVERTPTLPKAIKAATAKLTAAIHQSEVESNGPTIAASRLENHTTQVIENNRSTLLTCIPVAATIPKTAVNHISLEALATPGTKKIAAVNSANTITPTSGKIFNNVSGTIILPVKKSQTVIQQLAQNETAQSQPNTTNKTVYQKKTLQVVNAQGQVKTVQMFIAAPKTLANSVAGKPLSNTSIASGIHIITSKALSAQSIITSKTTTTTANAILNSKLEIAKAPASTQFKGSSSPSTSVQQNHNLNTNNANNTMKPLTTSKNVVFQKEGKLYIIDPLQMKLKQHRKNQVSLLKPQVKQQTQQMNTTLQSAVACDHDYAPRPTSSQNSLPSFSNQNAALVRMPQVHLGMRETRLCAMITQDYHKYQRIQLERKFNSMEFGSMRSAVEYLLRRLPLIANDKQSSAAAFPFVRTTAREFHSLPAFKQRSFEWLRAKFIARILRNPKSLQALHAAGEETFWSTREIATFARFYAFTPPIKALQQQEPELSELETVPGSKEHFTALIKTEVKSEKLQLEYDSLSPSTHVTQWMSKMKSHLEDAHHQLTSDDVIIIDDNDEAGAKKEVTIDHSTSEALVTKRIYGSPLKFQSNTSNLSYMPPPARLETAFQYVGDICKDISVRLRPEEIVPGIVHPSAQTALAHISQLFIERLLRQTVANQNLHQQEQHGSNSHLPHNNPDRIVTSQDIRKTISQSAELDFLTNRHLGVTTQRMKNE